MLYLSIVLYDCIYRLYFDQRCPISCIQSGQKVEEEMKSYCIAAWCDLKHVFRPSGSEGRSTRMSLYPGVPSNGGVIQLLFQSTYFPSSLQIERTGFWMNDDRGICGLLAMDKSLFTRTG